ncbi:M16 family metallopeptidase [Vulcanisaeta sp. JCM 14467]|uniref:M16 family metallopeptidase n=1 Tax=Vulcanisaeta sp. JCM 14467 TaxID=1295370 RepID=UPI000AB14A54|nr:insulinase family protein [Vulcanisaeta sp. JCM 14467]
MGMANKLFIKSPVKDVVVLDIKLNLGSLQEVRPGLANVLIPLWRMSNYARELERIGISFSFEKGLDALTLRVKARYSVVSKAVSLIENMLANPVIDRLVDAIREARTGINVNREDTAIRSVAEALRVLFGDHPYSRHPLAYDYRLDDVTREEVKGAIDNLRVLSLTVVAPEDTVDLNMPYTNYSKVPVAKFGSGEVDVRLEGKAQATITIAYPSYEITDLENSFRVTIVNTVLGGMGLISRLYREVRVKRGLAYYAYSMYWPLGSSGVLMAMAGVRREVLKEALDVMLNTISDVAITEEELDMAVRNRVGRLKVTAESPDGIAMLYSVIPTYDLPRDYYDRFINYVSRLRPEDVSRELRNLPKPVIAIVG